jgi:deoxyribonuclease-1
LKNKFTLLFLPVLFLALRTYPQALTVSSPQMDFGDVYENAPHSLPLVLTNTLNRTVNVYGIRFYTTYGLPAFSSPDQHFSITALATDTIWVTFSPRHNIVHNSEMVIINDGLRGYTSVDLIGQGKFSNTYYNASENLSEENLKTALHTLTGVGYVSLGYNVARDSMFMGVDNKKKNGQGATQNTIECIYTGREAVGYTDRSDCQTNFSFNTEHTFPQSYFASAEPMKSDLHHLFPTDDLANNARADNPYGIVTGGTTWTGGGSSATNSIFEPRDEQKGKAARALMYFILRYQNYSNFFTSQETLLRSWNHDFPVDAIEQTRNERINSMQHNRNPFIDYPQFIERITSLSNNSSAVLVKSVDVTEDTIIYGYVSQGVDVDFNYVIVNNGTADIDLTNFSLSDPQFTFNSGSNDGTVNAGESHVVSIRLHATSTSTLHEFLTFNTNVSGHLNMSIPIFANDSVFDTIDEISENDIAISPVPAGNFVKVQCSGEKIKGISIYDVEGKKLMEERSVSATSEVMTDVSILAPGLYLIAVEMNQKNFFRKFMKY